MHNPSLLVWAAVLSLVSGCAGVGASQRKAWEESAAPAVTALQAARFEESTQLAKKALAEDPKNSRANAVLGVSLFRMTMHDLVGDALTIGSAMVASGLLRRGGDFVSTDMVDFALKRADERLAEVDAKLAVAQLDREVSLELCMACWEVDWNRNGEFDDRDRKLFQIERDANGVEYPADDPRRTPTFRFDVSDVHWLRALVSFQRGAINLAQAWDWKVLIPVVMRGGGYEDVRIPLRSAEQVKTARGFILAGLAQSSACRDAALAETDDEREWLPNPKQKSHAMPLEVDEKLYETWGQIVGDAERLVRGDEALSVAELAQLGDHQWEHPPGGYLNLGRWLGEPREIVIPMSQIDELENRADRIEAVLTAMFGASYSQKGPASQLPSRLKRMKDDVSRGNETFEKKLRYLLWIN